MSTSLKRLSKSDWMAEGGRLFGGDMMRWRFVCPICGHVQTPEDLRPFAGRTPNDAYFNCIGRFTGGRRAFGKNPKGTPAQPCDYTSGGLFCLAPVRVIDEEGREHPVFEFDHSGEVCPS